MAFTFLPFCWCCRCDASTNGTIGAGDFGYNRSFDILVMVVLGGMGSLLELFYQQPF